MNELDDLFLRACYKNLTSEEFDALYDQYFADNLNDKNFSLKQKKEYLKQLQRKLEDEKSTYTLAYKEAHEKSL